MSFISVITAPSLHKRCMKKKRSFLKWAGGKYSLAHEIRSRLPEAECLIEPFVGAGSIFLNTDYERYILADINSDLINLYKIVQKQSDKFIPEAQSLFTQENNQPSVFYELRKTFNQSHDSYQRSLLFLYLNRHGYNGLCRYNSKGEFNVPFGSYKRPYFPEKELLFFSEKAQKATFICQHYEQVMQEATKNSVVYCDPPYVPLTATANFTSYHAKKFSEQEQQNLAKLAYQTAKSRGIPVLISNHDTQQTQFWYQDAKLYSITASRVIGCSKISRKKVNELLALYL